MRNTGNTNSSGQGGIDLLDKCWMAQGNLAIDARRCGCPLPGIGSLFVMCSGGGRAVCAAINKNKLVRDNIWSHLWESLSQQPAALFCTQICRATVMMYVDNKICLAPSDVNVAGASNIRYWIFIEWGRMTTHEITWRTPWFLGLVLRVSTYISPDKELECLTQLMTFGLGWV